MSACDCYDLMRLATDEPVYKKVVGYYKNSLIILESENDDWFAYNVNKTRYICTKLAKDKLELLKTFTNNTSSVTKDLGYIEKIESKSAIFSMLFTGEFASTFYNCAQQIYYGFGYPIYLGDEDNMESTKRAAKIYTSFIVSLMKFYGVNDLLQLGGNIQKLPIVEINVNANREIDLMVNPNTGLGLSIGKDFEIVNYNDLVNKEGFASPNNYVDEQLSMDEKRKR